MATRPLTQREIARSKKTDDDLLTVYNASKKMVLLQTRKPGKDFYISEQTIRLGAGKKFTTKASNFNMDQLNNLSVRGEIKLIGKND